MTAKHSHSLVVACDMPFLNLKLLNYMVSLPLDYDVLIPKIGGWFEPLHAIYSRRCIGPIERRLQGHHFRVQDLLDDVSVHCLPECVIDTLDPQYRSFFNVNSPKKLREAQLISGENALTTGV